MITDTTRAVLAEFAAFVRHPRLMQPSGLGAVGAWRCWAVLVALQIGVLVLVLLPFIALWQKLFALPSPDAFGKLAPAMLVPTVVLVAPVLEELLFRGWLTGRPRALWLLGSGLVAGAVLFASMHGLDPLVAGALLLGALVAAVAGWLVLRRRAEAPGWFAAGFAPIFAVSVAIFAASHLVNYPHITLAVLPLVLPQLWGALVLGFVRMRIGLPASILAHMAANASTLTLAMAMNG